MRLAFFIPQHFFLEKNKFEECLVLQKNLFGTMKNIAIFASGEGSNAQNIIDYFNASDKKIKVALVISNNAKSNVLNRAKEAGVQTAVIDRELFYNSNQIVEKLKTLNIDLIVLAGFLWKVPENLIKNFPGKIINIHPALLPKYGGKGMYGRHVHNAVVEAKEKESGISIHFVNEEYDKGQLISQHTCTLEPEDTAETVAHKIHQLEQEFFPKVIFDLLK